MLTARPDLVDCEPSLAYFDFEILINQAGPATYPVSLIRSPAGELAYDIALRLPYAPAKLDAFLHNLPAVLTRSSQPHPQASNDDKVLRLFGQRLFSALLGGEIGALYRASRVEAERQGRGLRIKLRIRPPYVAALPWELLFDPDEKQYVGLSRRTPIVRYLEIDRPARPLRAAPPLRMLGMAASPRRMYQIEAVEEQRMLEDAVGELCARGLLELVWWKGQTRRDLQAAMRAGPWHVFHFIGHGASRRGAGEAAIILADETGQPECLPASELARLLAGQPELRLVVLNACHTAHSGAGRACSSVAATLLRHGLPAVIAMQHPLSNQAAVHFSHELYRSVAGWLPVDAAVADGRKAIRLSAPNSLEWATPQLYLRAPDGVLFAPAHVAGSVEARCTGHSLAVTAFARPPACPHPTLRPTPRRAGPVSAARWPKDSAK
jgi:hypothetical protein